MTGIECEECYQIFSSDHDFKSHIEYCIQSELPVLDSFEKDTESGEEFNADSPPKLEPIEQESCEEEYEVNEESPTTSSNYQSDFNLSKLAFSFDNGECPPGYKEVFTKSLNSEDGNLSAFYSIQRPAEWSDDESIESNLLNQPKVSEYRDEEIDSKTYIVSNSTKSFSSRMSVDGSLTKIDGPGLKAYTKMKCPICGLILFRHNYGAHYRIHTGELPYQCFFCDRKFRTSSSRKVHHRLHTQEKPYACKMCSYKTITKRNLDRHFYNQHTKSTNRRPSVKFKIVGNNSV